MRKQDDKTNTQKPNRLLSIELLSIMKECKCGPDWNEPASIDEINNTLVKAKVLLDELMRLYICYKSDDTGTRDLSMRQIICTSDTLNYLKEYNFHDAYHEFYDCVDDRGKGWNDKQVITAGEFMLYYTITTYFLDKISEYVKQTNS